jgi:ribosome recycling factor
VREENLMIDSIYQDTKENMEKAIAALKKDLKRVH